MGNAIRVSVTYTDNDGHMEGPLFSAASAAVANTNDAPMAVAGSITLAATRTYTFTGSEFGLTDDDGDMIASIIVQSAPTVGTLSLSGTAIASFPATAIAIGSIGNLSYAPATGATAADPYATFTYNVVDDGSDGSGDNTSTNNATITITLTTQDNTPATGDPSLSSTSAAEDTAITAGQGTVVDGNQSPINSLGTISWQWQEADSDGSTPAMPDASTWTDISGATNAAFTPDDDHVGQFLRACLSFTDRDGYMEERCAVTGQVANVDDAPTAPTLAQMGTDLSAAGPNEDAVVTTTPPTDDDGLGTITWRWEAMPAGGSFAAIAGETDDSFTPLQAQVGSAIRACARYMDINGGKQEDICSAATMPVVNVNDAPVANISLTQTYCSAQSGEGSGMRSTIMANITEVAEDDCISASVSTEGASLADEDGFDGTTYQASIQTRAAGASSWTEVGTGNNGSQYQLTQTDVDAGSVRICVFYTDDHDTNEGFATLTTVTGAINSDNRGTPAQRQAGTICTTPIEVDNVNDPAGGAATFSYGAVNGFTPTAATEDSQITVSFTGITDEDGVTMAAPTWAWFHETTGSSGFVAIMDGGSAVTGTTFTPDNDNVGDVLRACATFTDDHNTEETVCTDTAPVLNTNDVPVPQAGSIALAATRTYTFDGSEFSITDVDGDAITHIIIAGLPTAGTLSNGGTAITSAPSTAIAIGSIGNLVYAPADGATAAANYATFTYNVTDDGDGPGGDTAAAKTSSTPATITVTLNTEVNTPATGTPTLSSAAAPEATAITAAQGTVVDGNNDRPPTPWAPSAGSGRMPIRKAAQLRRRTVPPGWTSAGPPMPHSPPMMPRWASICAPASASPTATAIRRSDAPPPPSRSPMSMMRPAAT